MANTEGEKRTTTMDDASPLIRARYTYTVIGTDTDILDRLTWQALFSYKQESATVHAYELGMSAEVDRVDGVWLLRRSRAVWYQRPKFRDEVTVETWSRGVRLVTWLRDFHFYINGDFSKPAGVGSSEWIVARRNGHKPIRPREIMSDDDIAALSTPQFTIDEKSPRLADLPALERPMLIREIGYTDIDHNFHVNNTFYLKYGIDAVALFEKAKGTLSETGLDFLKVDVSYVRELSFGDTVSVYVSRGDDGYLVEGKNQGGERCFLMALSTLER